MTHVTRMTKDAEHRRRGAHEIANRGPTRTLKAGDRITIYGDLEVIAVEGRCVQVRVVKASAPPPEPVMFPARSRSTNPETKSS